MSDKKIVYAGVNAFKCICDDGTVFIPVSTDLIARLRCGETVSVTGHCHKDNHTQRYVLATRPPFPAFDE